ncbi:hypothetical protein HKX42_04195 [Salinisphaera sp. USBA-960]|uniref:MucB/RseB C-terminal domain-containing protein n=1 Tax=Salinisphaera orenii TaxID=856731 RepID=UPI000DBE3CC0|nr:hypothetical protein [Salifodinibacter halophilus]NNC26076.1 hypothetical protein [Salifodinibacter halophilus]
MSLKATGLCLVGVLAAVDVSAAASSQASASADEQTPTPSELLSSATQAIQTASYRGVLLSAQAGQMNTMRVFHRQKNGEEQQRLVSTSGTAREIIRTGSKTVSILPNKELVLISRKRQNSLLNKLTQSAVTRIQTSYSLEDKGSDRVAGRQCRLIQIKPKDRFRYGYWLSIDEKTHLPLKLKLVSKHSVLERLLFTEIKFDKSLPDKYFESQHSVKGYRVVKHESIKKVADDEHDKPSVRWNAEKLPPGFERIRLGVRQVSKNAQVRQILYTDGLASVSAFIAPAGLRTPLKGGSARGPVHAFGRQLDNKQITVVGKVPAATVKLIAKHLTLKGEH